MLKTLLVLASLAALALSADVAASTAIPTPTQDPLLVKRQATSQQSSTSSSLSIPQTAAAGGLTYLTPAQTAAASYYKIASGNPITFGWNYTSLYVTPSSLTFEARCTANGYTYPITTIAAAETSLVWDPWQYAQSPNALPLAQASYTLRVYDERGADATAEAGRFNGNNAIINFALYSPQPYTPLASGWTCAGCSFASLSKTVSHPLVIAVPVTIALVLIGGAGVLGR
ncbi:hypothetical protein JCM3766R1_003694 [Sporobolomyces carnicolor]